MSVLIKIDILGGKWCMCECGDPYATHFAVDMGIMVEPLCFNCIRLLIYHRHDEHFVEVTQD